MKKRLWIGAIVALIVGGLSFVFLSSSKLQGSTPASEVLFKETPVFSKLTGLQISPELKNENPIAVVIENYTPIRFMQKGLEEASIVYETLAEGGITRLLAIYNGAPVKMIGPVRSARPYLINWAKEYKAAFLHVGGSHDALEQLSYETGILNIDEYADRKTIWRSKAYDMPHNAFTSTENVLSALNDLHYDNALQEPRFQFKDPSPQPDLTQTITIDFWTSPYFVKYIYNPVTHSYDRYNGGVRHHKLSPTNVIVQYTEQEILDSEGRRYINTTSGGRALVFNDGKTTTGRWKKTGDYTVFVDETDTEIKLNPGQTWIEIVPLKAEVKYF